MFRAWPESGQTWCGERKDTVVVNNKTNQSDSFMKDFVEDAKDFGVLPEKNRLPSREMVYQTYKYFRAITLAAE